MHPNTEEIEGPSHIDIGIATEEVLNEKDLLDIQEESLKSCLDPNQISMLLHLVDEPKARRLLMRRP